MPRARTVSDVQVFGAVRALLAADGPRGVTFAAVARASGLSGPSLVQRHGSREGLLRAALAAGWEALEAGTLAAVAAAPPGPRGAAQLLKTLGAEAGELSVLASGLVDKALRRRAAGWRAGVEAALAERLGGNRQEAAEAAALLFLAWQGRLHWQEAGGGGFRLKSAAQRLAGPPPEPAAQDRPT